MAYLWQSLFRPRTSAMKNRAGCGVNKDVVKYDLFRYLLRRNLALGEGTSVSGPRQTGSMSMERSRNGVSSSRCCLVFVFGDLARRA